jgi:hypothetical protein
MTARVGGGDLMFLDRVDVCLKLVINIDSSTLSHKEKFEHEHKASLKINEESLNNSFLVLFRFI